MFVRYACLLGLIGVLVVQAGCGPPPNAGATVKGKILQGGQPLSLPATEGGPPGADEISVSLFPADNPDGMEQPGEYDESDGTVTFLGESADAVGIPPGKYRVVVGLYPGGDFEADILKNAYGMDNSPIEIEVPESAKGQTHDIGTIDLDDHKPTEGG